MKTPAWAGVRPSGASTPVAVRETDLHAGDGWRIVLLFAATLVAYFPALGAGLIWNDSEYVTRGELQSLRGLWRIWFEIGATEQFYPLLHSSFWFQHLLWGDAPAGYHIVNVLLHAAAALLLVPVMRRLELRGAWLAAFLFALHPLTVESVAWVSEQKNTLSLVFYLAAAWCYLRFDARRGRGDYALATGFFVLALLSKSVVATLPAALLVALWWRRGTLRWREEVRPLVPWFVLGLGMGAVTSWVERIYLGTAGSDFTLTSLERVMLAGRSTWFYVGKIVWPANLMFVYPRWDLTHASHWNLLYTVAVVLVLVVLYFVSKRRRGPLAVALLFGGSLLPVLGFFNLFGFLFSYVADHWQYLPLALVMAGGSAGLTGFLDRMRYRPKVILLGVLVGSLGLLTWRQTWMYRDVETVYRETIRRNPAAWMAYNNLGTLLLERGDTAEAAVCFQRTIALKPDAAKARSNLATILRNERRWPEAFELYEEAIRLDPSFANTRAQYANALRESGRLSEAIAQHTEALRLDPLSAGAHNDFSVTLRTAGRLPDAIAQAQEAVRLDGSLAPAHLNLAVALALSGRSAEAAAAYAEARRLNPALPAMQF